MMDISDEAMFIDVKFYKNRKLLNEGQTNSICLSIRSKIFIADLYRGIVSH